MARARDAIPQRSFGLGAVREDALERGDIALGQQSLREALNCQILSTEAIERRGGSFFIARVGGRRFMEITPADGVRADLVIVPGGVQVWAETGELLAEFDGAAWADETTVWAEQISPDVLIGSQASWPKVLRYEDGEWSFADFSFESGPSGSTLQPYWQFKRGGAITPSARTGAVTVTADQPVFAAGHAGQIVRYLGREILIEAVVSPLSVTGTVIEELPPSYRIVVANRSGYRVGDAVEEDTLGGQGVIVAIPADVTNALDITATKFWSGFAAPNKLVGPDANSAISSVTAINPLAAKEWDEPLFSAVYGYPGAAGFHAGRLVFCDFPQAPDAVAASAAGVPADFTVGANDDDAIVDSIGAADGARVLHVCSAEDLILLTTKGLYYQETRDGSVLTPRTFYPRRFDTTGASRVRPIVVQDGVVFVNASGRQVGACVLQGDIYRAWRYIPISDFANHVVTQPVALGSTNDETARPEKFLFVVNADGTAAVGRWTRDGGADTLGWCPWVTSGDFLHMSSFAGGIHAIVSRQIGDEARLFLERFDDAAKLDCASGFVSPAPAEITNDEGEAITDDGGNSIEADRGGAEHLEGATAWLWAEGFDFGLRAIGAGGVPNLSTAEQTILADAATAQAGFTFTTRITPWPHRSARSYAGDEDSKRIISMTVSVQNSDEFLIGGRSFNGYVGGDDFGSPSPLRTKRFKKKNMGRDDHPEIPITKDTPGTLRVLMLAWKVQV